MGIFHIVIAQFKEDASPAAIQNACNRMLSMKDECLHPKTNRPYLKSGIGGSDNSLQGLQNGMTHVFVFEFENDDDRKYYVEKDPAHLALEPSIGDVVAKVQVIDFIPGIF